MIELMDVLHKYLVSQYTFDGGTESFGCSAIIRSEYYDHCFISGYKGNWFLLTTQPNLKYDRIGCLALVCSYEKTSLLSRLQAQTHHQGKPSREKICFCLVFFKIALTPPPLVFWNPLRNFFQNLILYKLKFLKVFGLWLSPQI